MTGITEQKAALRREFGKKRAELPAEAIEKISIKICEHILTLPEFQAAEQVLLYYPVKGEPSPLPLLRKAIEAGKTVGFPKSNKRELSLGFYSVESERDLVLGAYSIPEPKSGSEQLVPNEKTLCIVPALLFSKDFHRLGYGKGFYDRFLADFCGKSAGFAMSEFVLDRLPTEKTDIPLDLLASEKGALRREG